MLRHRQSEHSPDLARQKLRDQREKAMPRAAKLQHVQPIVIGLDQGG
jgi:hypothetical protein